MKKVKQFSVLLLFATLSGSLLAEWVEIQRFEDGMRVFVDPASARRTADTAQIVHLVRWGEPQVEEGLPPYLSTIVSTSYDCIHKREKYLASTSYAGAMGNGVEVDSDDGEAEGWYSISVASMEEKLWKIACAAKQPLP